MLRTPYQTIGKCCKTDIHSSYAGFWFGPDFAEKCRRIGPGGCLVQDGDSAGVAGVAHNRRHPAPNAGPRHPPIFAISNPSMEAEDDPGRSTSETSGSQFTI